MSWLSRSSMLTISSWQRCAASRRALQPTTSRPEDRAAYDFRGHDQSRRGQLETDVGHRRAGRRTMARAGS